MPTPLSHLVFSKDHHLIVEGDAADVSFELWGSEDALGGVRVRVAGIDMWVNPAAVLYVQPAPGPGRVAFA